MKFFKDKSCLLTKVKIMIDFKSPVGRSGGLRGDHEINANKYAKADVYL